MAGWYYTIPSDNWEQQPRQPFWVKAGNYTIPSDNWEQQLITIINAFIQYYTIPSDNWEQQLYAVIGRSWEIIPYQAITGNNNAL